MPLPFGTIESITSLMGGTSEGLKSLEGVPNIEKTMKAVTDEVLPPPQSKFEKIKIDISRPIMEMVDEKSPMGTRLAGEFLAYYGSLTGILNRYEIPSTFAQRQLDFEQLSKMHEFANKTISGKVQKCAQVLAENGFEQINGPELSLAYKTRDIEFSKRWLSKTSGFGIKTDELERQEDMITQKEQEVREDIEKYVLLHKVTFGKLGYSQESANKVIVVISDTEL